MSAFTLVVGSAVAFAPVQPASFALRSSTQMPATRKHTARAASRMVNLRCAVADGVTGNVGDQLLDRENAHVVGLLQNPFDAQGSSGAFPGLPEHLSRM
eukprot:1908978-Rhodomonas_salina.3